LPPQDESGPGFAALNDATLRIHRRGRTLEGLLDAVAAEAKSLLRADHALVWLLDPDWGDLRGRRSPGEDEFRFPLGTGLTGRVAKTRKAFRTANAPDEPGYDAEVDSPPSDEAPALMAVPVLDDGDALVGVLVALGGRVFGDEDERAAAQLADHAAAAIRGATERADERRLLLDLTAALADAVDRRSPWTLDHSYRVREYCKRLGRAAGLDADSQLALELAALLHGVGRGEMAAGGEPEAGPHEAGERMKTHVVFAEAILRGVRFPGALAAVPEAVLHCLRGAAGTGGAGGAGRAGGPKAKEPSALGRMLLIADSYDVYLHGRTGGAAEGGAAGESDALERLERGAGEVFDAELVRLFVDRRCHVIEQRRFPRMDYEMPVDVTVLGPDGAEDRRLQAVALDLSEGGVLLRSTEPVEPGTAVRLEIHLPSGDMEAIAKVARVLPGLRSGPGEAGGERPGEGAGCRIGVYFLWHGAGAP
jgi:hypothetical protein